MKKKAVSIIAGLGRRLVSSDGVRLNPSHAPVGMLDVERITRVAAPVSTLVSRPAHSSHSSLSSKV